MNLMQTETVTLAVKEWMAQTMIDELELPQEQLRVLLRFHAENLAYVLVASMKLPAKVLQDDSVIAEYPSTLWAYIKRALGFRTYKRTQVRLNEYLTFPRIALPKGAMFMNYRVAVEARLTESMR